MSTSLTEYAKSGKLPAIDKDAIAKALTSASAEETTGSTSGAEYVTFSGKTGAITYGRDHDDLPEDRLFLMEPRSSFRGWVCWKDGKPIARHQWSLYQPDQAVPESALEDKGPYRSAQDGWRSLLGFGFVSIDDAKTAFSFSTNSASGKNAVVDLFDEIAARALRGEPCFPLFYFTKERFQAQGSWNFKPRFVVEGWLTEEEAAAIVEPDLTSDLTS